MTPELQPCPAGHQAEYYEIKPDGYSNPGTPSTWGIKCNTNCIWSVGFYRTKAEAAAAWNRPPDPRVEELEHDLLAAFAIVADYGTIRDQLAAERAKEIELQERIDSLTKQSQIIESDRQIACMELDAERAKVERLMADIYFLMRDTNCQCDERKEQGFAGKCSYCGVVDAIAFVKGK